MTASEIHLHTAEGAPLGLRLDGPQMTGSRLFINYFDLITETNIAVPALAEPSAIIAAARLRRATYKAAEAITP